MTATTDALDELLDPRTGRSPAPGSLAYRLTGGAVALMTILRLAHDDLAVTTATIDPADGRVTLTIPDYVAAEQLATALALPAAVRITEVDHGLLVKRWSGRWADWPITVLHVFVPSDTGMTAVAR